MNNKPNGHTITFPRYPTYSISDTNKPARVPRPKFRLGGDFSLTSNSPPTKTPAQAKLGRGAPFRIHLHQRIQEAICAAHVDDVIHHHRR